MAGVWEPLLANMAGLAGAGTRGNLDSGSAWESGARGTLGHLRSWAPTGDPTTGTDYDHIIDDALIRSWGDNPANKAGANPTCRVRCLPSTDPVNPVGTLPGKMSTNNHRFCYICGFPIQWSNGMSRAGSGTGDEGTWFGSHNHNRVPINSGTGFSYTKAGSGECEHASPSSLMSSTVGPNRTKIQGALNEFYRLTHGVDWENKFHDHQAFQLYIWNELYDWAHVACNQKKIRSNIYKSTRQYCFAGLADG